MRSFQTSSARTVVGPDSSCQVRHTYVLFHQCPGTVERTRQVVSGSSNVDPVLQCRAYKPSPARTVGGSDRSCQVRLLVSCFQCPRTVERTRQIVSGSSNVDPFFSVECPHVVRSAVPAPRLRSAVSSCARGPASSVPVFCFFCAGVLLLTLEMSKRESLSGPSCLGRLVIRDPDRMWSSWHCCQDFQDLSVW